jgi:hypothetical protein
MDLVDNNGTNFGAPCQGAEVAAMEIWNGCLHTLAPRLEHAEGYYGRCLVGFGVEVSAPRDHLLAFGVEHVPDPTAAPDTFAADVRRQRGISFVAHPLDRGSRLLRLPPYRWSAGYQDVTGIELINAMSLWVGRAQHLPGALAHLVLRSRALEADRETFALWDRLLAERPTPMVAGLDAHAYRFGPLTVFPYPWLFRALQMYVYIVERPSGTADDLQLLYAALGAGRSFAAVTAWAQPEGFHFELDGALPGDTVVLRAGLTAHLLMPLRGKGRILQDGRVLAEGDHDLAATITAPGPVRAEVWLGRRPWIVANPVYVVAEPSGR